MKRIFPALFLMFFTYSGNILFAQTSARDGAFTTSIASNSSTATDTDWSFYIDEESNTYYIDFETINVNLNSIVLKNAQGNVIRKEDVLDLPVNTIYELDLSTVNTGRYTLELHSFTKVLHKNIEVK